MNNLKEKLQDMINDNEGLEYGENVIEDGNIVYDGMTLDLNAMTEYELKCEIEELENATKSEEVKNWKMNYDSKLYSYDEDGKRFYHETDFIDITEDGKIIHTDCSNGNQTEIEYQVYEVGEERELTTEYLKEIYAEMN